MNELLEKADSELRASYAFDNITSTIGVRPALCLLTSMAASLLVIATHMHYSSMKANPGPM